MKSRSRPTFRHWRNTVLALAILPYLVLLVTDAVRNRTGFPRELIRAIYFLTAAIYVAYVSRPKDTTRLTVRYLPVWLSPPTLWCLIEAIIPRILAGMALLGWTSCAFFVPSTPSMRSTGSV
jgi:hypothetical protein